MAPKGYVDQEREGHKKAINLSPISGWNRPVEADNDPDVWSCRIPAMARNKNQCSMLINTNG